MLSISTDRDTQFLDITGEAEGFVEELGFREGVLHIHIKHTTAAVVINENEAGLVRDLEGLFNALAPKGAGYEHDRIDKNAHSHLKAVLCGGEKSVPIIDGRLQLGTWQKIFLAEFDGPRRREVLLHVTKEA